MENISVSYYGYFTPYGGYGIANFNWVKHLRRWGVKVYPHAKFLPEYGSKEWDALNNEEKNITRIPFQKERIGIIETTPFDFDIIDTEVKIANTMAESSKLGKPWIDACSRMDYIIVPNNFQRQVFVDSGIPEGKVRVIQHGTETEKFPYFNRPNRSVYTFGIAGWLDNRKGVFDLIRAFSSEFNMDEPVRLLLHSTNMDFGYYRNFTDNRIITDCSLLTPDKLNEFYQSLDCFVFPSKAEGVGQPPREAMATGLPVILTKYSGLEEVAQENIAYPLAPHHFVDRTDMIEQPGKWAQIDIQELMYQMRYVYEHREEAQIKGLHAAEYIRDHHSWEAAAKSMIQFLQGV